MLVLLFDSSTSLSVVVLVLRLEGLPVAILNAVCLFHSTLCLIYCNLELASPTTLHQRMYLSVAKLALLGMFPEWLALFTKIPV